MANGWNYSIDSQTQDICSQRPTSPRQHSVQTLITLCWCCTLLIRSDSLIPVSTRFVLFSQSQCPNARQHYHYYGFIPRHPAFSALYRSLISTYTATTRSAHCSFRGDWESKAWGTPQRLMGENSVQCHALDCTSPTRSLIGFWSGWNSNCIPCLSVTHARGGRIIMARIDRVAGHDLKLTLATQSWWYVWALLLFCCTFESDRWMR